MKLTAWVAWHFWFFRFWWGVFIAVSSGCNMASVVHCFWYWKNAKMQKCKNTKIQHYSICVRNVYER